MTRTVLSISVFGASLLAGSGWLFQWGSSALAASSVQPVNEKLVSNVTGDDEAGWGVNSKKFWFGGYRRRGPVCNRQRKVGVDELRQRDTKDGASRQEQDSSFGK